MMSNPVIEKIKYHLPALGTLFALHCIVFARLIFRTPEGVPYATIPWDFASAYSPWLIYIGDCFKSGIFPLWAPYVGGGTPFFINPQTQLYAPSTLLIGLVFGYTPHITQLQAVFMLFFGGAGAYLFSYALWRSRGAGLVTAMCYGLSSVLFSNMEHMTSINSTTLLPWLFWATLMTDRKAAWGHPVIAFFIYFLITAGYPGVILMILLWLFIYTLYLSYSGFDSWWGRLRAALHYGSAWLLGLGLAGAHWIPVIIHRREFTRGKALSLEQSLSGGSLLFKHLWGFIFMFMTVKPLPGEEIDISMRGLYFGALAIPLIVAALILVKNRDATALLILSVGALLMACGIMFFGRIALHILIPPLNLSRFPSVDSRALMLMGLAVLAGGGMMLLQQGHPLARQLVTRACIFLLALLAIGLFALRAVYDTETYYNVAFNYITAEMLFVGLAVLALRAFSGRKLMSSMIALLALELGTCALANFGVMGAPVEPNQYRAFRASHQRAFTPNAADMPRIGGGLNLLSEESGQGYITKSFYLSEYNPLRLYRFDRLIANGYTDWLTNGKRVVALPTEAQPGDFSTFQQQSRPVEYSILAYSPNRIVYRVHAAQDSLLVFNEIYFPGWRATMDGQQMLVKDMGGLRSLKVAGGDHLIVMSFKPTSFYIGLTVSLISTVIFLCWVFSLIYRSRKRRRVEARDRYGQAELQPEGVG